MSCSWDVSTYRSSHNTLTPKYLPAPPLLSHRTNFYDSYGVIRDILQNHLTEILALVAADSADTRPWPSVKATLFEHVSHFVIVAST